MKINLIIISIIFSNLISHAQDIIQFTDEPENLGPNVNSVYDELGPVISPDGKTLYICRGENPQNMGEQDIWKSELQEDETWSKAINIGGPVNTASSDFVSAISNDGNTMLIGKKYSYSTGATSSGVSLSFKDDRGWKFPKSQIIDKYENRNDYVSYNLAGDEKAILMSIETKKGYGALDIHVSFPIKGNENNWTKPLNLGSVINTSETDGTPFLAADGKTLYFSSDGHPGGFGGRDVWVSRRLDDSWTNWSKPQNMGDKINTPDWDAYFSIPASGEYAYFVSGKNSYGEEDIFRIKMPTEAKPEPVVLVIGKLLDKKTNEPVKGKIQYEDLSTGELVGTINVLKDGKYSIVLLKGRKYGVFANSKGYYAISDNLDLTNLDKFDEVNKNISMAPIIKDEIVRLNNIFFDLAKSSLKEESFLELNRLLKMLTENAALRIEISGHTDNVGSDEDNLKLSQDRAQSVVDYLTKNGIKKSRLEAKGYGEAAPVSTNDTEEGKSLNRRVEFKIL